MRKIARRYKLPIKRSWRSVLKALKEPLRSEYAFFPHHYVFAPEYQRDSLSPDESTPINAKKDMTSEPNNPQMSKYYILHLIVIGVSGFCCVWLTLFPISANRLYNMQVDVFNTNHAHTLFFFKQCLYLGQIFGAAMGGWLGDRLGRAGTLELASIPYIVGWLLVGVSYGELSVLIGRYLLGIAAGVICVIAPVYLAEITSSEYRGRIICVQSIIASLGRLCYLGFGALFIYLSRSYFGFNLSEWKVLAAIGLFQGLALLLAMQFLPDSPTWLIVRHDDRESAFEIISRLFNGNNKYAELQVNSLIHADIMADSTKRNDMNTRFYRPLGLCCVLVTLRTISNYLIDPALSPTSSKSYVVSAFGVGLELGDVTLLYVMSFLWLAGVFGTFVCFLLIDVKGRGTVLKFGCGVVIVCCAVLVTSEYNAAELTGSNVLELADSGSAAMLIITAAHHIGLGITPVVLTSELFPARYRTASVSLVVIWEGLVNLAMSYSIPWIGSHFDSLTQVVGLCVSIVVVCNMCAFIIAWLYLPETSRRSLQEIEAILSGWKPATPQQGYSNVRLSAAEPTYGTT